MYQHQDTLAELEQATRDELVRIAHLIYERGYNVSIDGNVSARLPDGTILITPSGAHNGFVTADQLVVMDRDGNVVRGQGRASSERILHLEAYRVRPDVGAVIHAHAPHALAASLAGIDLMQIVVSVAPVPTTEYARPSSAESAERMRPFLRGYDWGILPRHGVVTMGPDLWSAFLRLEGLEHYAHVVLLAHATGRPIAPLSDDRQTELLRFWGLGDRGEHLR
jgi:L-fuculose-phosphate aldolase